MRVTASKTSFTRCSPPNAALLVSFKSAAVRDGSRAINFTTLSMSQSGCLKSSNSSNTTVGAEGRCSIRSKYSCALSFASGISHAIIYKQLFDHEIAIPFHNSGPQDKAQEYLDRIEH